MATEDDPEAMAAMKAFLSRVLRRPSSDDR
jgi:hypothetical protein